MLPPSGSVSWASTSCHNLDHGLINYIDTKAKWRQRDRQVEAACVHMLPPSGSVSTSCHNLDHGLINYRDTDAKWRQRDRQGEAACVHTLAPSGSVSLSSTSCHNLEHGLIKLYRHQSKMTSAWSARWGRLRALAAAIRICKFSKYKLPQSGPWTN